MRDDSEEVREREQPARRSRRGLGAACLVVVLATAACGTSRLRLYEGPARGKQDVAVVRSIAEQERKAEERAGHVAMGYSISLRGVDGQLGPNNGDSYNSVWDGRFEVELLPGPHLLTVGMTQLRTKQDVSFQFNAEPGHEYRLEPKVGSVSPGDRTTTIQWSPMLTDVTTGAIVPVRIEE